MSEKRQTSKIFVGGLSWETTDQRLRTYFENYGAVSEAFVSFDRTTGRPRGFGFVVFEDPSVADKVVSLQHTIDRRDVEAKKAVPKEEHPAGKQPNGLSSQRTKKIFVGGLAPSVDEQAFRKYFEQYGAVEDAVVMYDHDNKRPRGFGFVTFISEEGVDAVFTGGSLQTLHDKPIEIKRAVPRDQIASARGKSTFAQQPQRMFSSTQQQPARMGSGQSGFAAAAMGPAFGGDNSPLNGTLSNSHSLGAPNAQSQMPSLTGAASLGAQGLPPFSHDFGAISQGLAAGLLNAMSGQLSNQLSTQLSTPANGLQSMGSSHVANHLQHVGSSQLQPMGSAHIQNIAGSQLPNLLQRGGSAQLPPITREQLQTLQLQASNGLQGMGSAQLQSASSGLLQGGFGLGKGDILGADYNHQHLRQNSNFNAAATSGLESAFAGMALEPQQSFELPPPNGFEERVNMLSAGSAGLGQLPSPKVTTAYSSSYPEGHTTSYNAPRDVAVTAQQW